MRSRTKEVEDHEEREAPCKDRVGRERLLRRFGHHYDAPLACVDVGQRREPTHILGDRCVPIAAHPFRQLEHRRCRTARRLHQAQQARATRLREKQSLQHGAIV